MLSLDKKLEASTDRAEDGASIIITGASGSLGTALAMIHAKPGVVMRLWGRDSARLEETAAASSSRGAKIRSTLFDLTDASGAVKRLLQEDDAERFDIAYLVAGSGETREPGSIVENPDQIARIAIVNYAAPCAMAAAIAERMALRGGGRIVLIGSAAGHHSLPSAPAYASSKAGLARFADALRIAVAPYGVSVTLAAPGFINTPTMHTQNGDRPFQISVDEAARRIVRAGARGRSHYVTPWQFRALRIIDTMLPAFVRDSLLRKL